MNHRRASVLLVTVTILSLFVPIAFAQGSNVKAIADFNKPVNVGQGQVLSPGHYTFELVQDQTDRSVFRVESDKGKNVTLTATNFSSRQSGIPTTETAASPDHIVLEDVNGQLYLHRISLGGQNRGFEFQLPENVRDKVNASTQVIIPAVAGNAQ